MFNQTRDLVKVGTYRFLCKFLFTAIFCLLPVVLSAQTRIQRITATTFLTEGRIQHRPDNLFSANPGSWAVRTRNLGRDEKVEIEFSQQITYQRIVVTNGYHEGRLYNQNARVKSLSIMAPRFQDIASLALLDTPFPQEFILDNDVSTRQLTLTLGDHYPGTRFPDVCLNQISFEPWKLEEQHLRSMAPYVEGLLPGLVSLAGLNQFTLVQEEWGNRHIPLIPTKVGYSLTLPRPNGFRAKVTLLPTRKGELLAIVMKQTNRDFDQLGFYLYNGRSWLEVPPFLVPFDSIHNVYPRDEDPNLPPLETVNRRWTRNEPIPYNYFYFDIENSYEINSSITGFQGYAINLSVGEFSSVSLLWDGISFRTLIGLRGM